MPSATRGTRRPRLVRQMEMADCGAACLASVLGAHGCHVDLAQLRDLTSTGRDGVSAAGMAAAARRFGFDATGVRVPDGQLEQLPAGAILHWDRNHFVVLEGIGRRGIRILDPALGRRVVPPETARERFSGVALLIAPADGAIEQSEAAEPRRRWSLYRRFLVGTRRPALLALACAAAVQAFALVHPLVLREVVDDVGSGAGRAGTLALGVAALVVGFLAAHIGRLLFLLALQRTIDVRMTLGVLEHLVSLPYAFLARRSAGDVALRIRSTLMVRQILTASALSAVLDGALVLLYLALIFAVDGRFGLLTAGAIAAQVIVVAATWQRLRQASAEALEAQSSSQSQLIEIINGLEVLKATGAARPAVDAWSGRLRQEVDAELTSSRLGGFVESALQAIRFGAPSALLVLGAARVSAGALDLADMLALAALSAAVTVPTGALLSTVCSLTTVVGYLERLDDLLATPPEQPGAARPKKRLSGAVRLDSVSFRYSALLPPAVADVTCDIAPGEHVAIVGTSGSGKTTVAMLIATLYEPSAGTVLLDGRPVADYDTDALRRRIGVVTQTTTLFNQSISDNIRFGRPWISDRDVARAARAAVIADDIESLPSGYDTLLGNSGSGLSGGQRQRLSLARALAGRPGLLILDEATSSLDAATESAVHASLATLDCTRITVAHRLTTVRAADRILMLDGGRLVAAGSYASLRRRNAQFRELVTGVSSDS